MSNKIDSYILSSIKTEPRVNFLIRAVENWDFKSIPELKVSSNIGDIYSGSGTQVTIDALERNKNVKYVEASK